MYVPHSIMKWDSMPLWPIIIPLLVGFFMACLFAFTENSGSLLKPMVCLLMSSIILYFSPKELGSRKELIGGCVFSIIFGIIPQIIFFVWFIIVILIWTSQTIYLWRHNFPAFRIGIWIGLGSCTGLFLGSFYAHYFLISHA
jgi:hypothetical protein